MGLFSRNAVNCFSGEILTDDDAIFADHIRRWIIGFHGDIKPQTDELVDNRVRSYLYQERLYSEKVRFLLEFLPNRPLCGLDIGSSAGGLSVALALQGVSMIGIEPSQAGVNVSTLRAQRLGLHNVYFQQGVGEFLPFKDSFFDFVVSLAVLEHVEDVFSVVQEAYRVLKPGGVAYFEVPNNLFPFEGHYKMIWLPMMPKFFAKIYVRARRAYPEFLDHLHYMNRSIVTNHFLKAGFVNTNDVYGEFLAGKASGLAWANGSSRLARIPFGAALVRLVCCKLPTSLFMNRVVCLIATKPTA